MVYIFICVIGFSVGRPERESASIQHWFLLGDVADWHWISLMASSSLFWSVLRVR